MVTGAATGRRGATFLAPWRPTLRAVDADAEMVARLRNGDEEAFVALVGRYQQPMLRLAPELRPQSGRGRGGRTGHVAGSGPGHRDVRGTLVVQDLALPHPRQPGASAGTKEHPPCPPRRCTQSIPPLQRRGTVGRSGRQVDRGERATPRCRRGGRRSSRRAGGSAGAPTPGRPAARRRGAVARRGLLRTGDQRGQPAGVATPGPLPVARDPRNQNGERVNRAVTAP